MLATFLLNVGKISVYYRLLLVIIVTAIISTPLTHEQKIVLGIFREQILNLAITCWVHLPFKKPPTLPGKLCAWRMRTCVACNAIALEPPLCSTCAAAVIMPAAVRRQNVLSLALHLPTINRQWVCVCSVRVACSLRVQCCTKKKGI